MKLTLISPRTRGEHLASISSPEGCETAYLILKNNGDHIVAERDPGAPLYHAVLPAMEAGEVAGQTSALSLYQLLVESYRRGEESTAARIEQLSRPTRRPEPRKTVPA